MKIIYESRDFQYIIETESNDFTAQELKELFSKLLVLDGFPPDVISSEEDGVNYHYVCIGDDEIIVPKAEYEELKQIKEKIDEQR